jgi:hypothetical protein
VWLLIAGIALASTAGGGAASPPVSRRSDRPGRRAAEQMSECLLIRRPNRVDSASQKANVHALRDVLGDADQGAEINAQR